MLEWLSCLPKFAWMTTLRKAWVAMFFVKEGEEKCEDTFWYQWLTKDT